MDIYMREDVDTQRKLYHHFHHEQSFWHNVRPICVELTPTGRGWCPM
jgi:hypothetical protein